MPTVTPPDGSSPAPPAPLRHPSEYLSPERLAQFWAAIEEQAALRGLPPLPAPR
jgi:hypothetical protein